MQVDSADVCYAGPQTGPGPPIQVVSNPAARVLRVLVPLSSPACLAPQRTLSCDGRCPIGENFLYVFKGARSAPRAVRRVIPHAGASRWQSHGTVGRRAQVPAGHSPRPDRQFRLSTLRCTAGCRPSASQRTARPRSAAVTSAAHPPRERSSSRRSSLVAST